MGKVQNISRIKNRVTSCFLLGLVSICCDWAIAQQGAVPVPRPKIVHSFVPDKFYETADPLPPGSPGELIRSVEFDRYDLPGDVLAVRILYHSQSAAGHDVAVSGVVLLPDKKAPNEGWPVIAWAHDLNGVARTCAPTLARNLRSGSLLAMYVQLGYAIVATDYAGLGSKGRNASSDMNSNANDVIYSITAARKAVPRLGARWVAMGMNEGAMAAIAVAEIEAHAHDANYLGSIALGGLQDVQQEFRSPQRVSAWALLSLAYGVQTVYPKFQVS